MKCRVIGSAASFKGMPISSTDHEKAQLLCVHSYYVTRSEVEARLCPAAMQRSLVAIKTMISQFIVHGVKGAFSYAAMIES